MTLSCEGMATLVYSVQLELVIDVLGVVIRISRGPVVLCAARTHLIPQLHVNGTVHYSGRHDGVRMAIQLNNK